MHKKTITLIAGIAAICIVGIIALNATYTGQGVYNIDDSILKGIDIAGIAEWEDYPGHIEGHRTERLTDMHSNYWWCSSTYNCSVTANFPEPRKINEIHMHACNINKEKYIPRTFEIWVKGVDRWTLLMQEENNTVLTDYKYALEEPRLVNGVEIRKLYGNSFYGIGDYVTPCIEEVEIFKVREVAGRIEEPEEEVVEEESDSVIYNWLRKVF
jgi:hypothetical protein